MSHIALYRAWRPQTFQDMVGQQHIIQTLQNAIREKRVSHAYLFNGPRGTGKTTAAKVFAKAVNCERGSNVEPCNECAACQGITAGNIMDVIEIDAASNRGIDEIREIRDKVRYAPSEVRYKVYIIDEVHMLTAEAFNALLKTLEEPPGHVIFILATTEPHRLPATIISRCQRFDFRQVSLEEQTARLKEICLAEGLQAQDDAVEYIARLSEGGMRDAISLLEQVSAFGSGEITLEGAVDVTGGLAAEHFFQLANALKERNAAAVLPLVEQLMQAGKSADKCIENLIYYFRDLLVLKLASGGVTDRIVDAEQFKQMADAFSSEQLFRMIDELHAYQLEMKHASQPQTLFEVAMLKLCTLSGNQAGAPDAAAGQQAASSSETAALRQQIQMLEQKVEQLMRSGVETGGQAESSQAARSTVNRGGNRATGNRGGFGSGNSSFRTKVKLDPYVAAANAPETVQARMKWSDLLQGVRDEKVTLHAWLKDGELAAVSGGDLVIAFKNDIHRETVEKPDHRTIVERHAEQILGQPLRLVTVMQREWQSAFNEGKSQEAAEILELQPDQYGTASTGDGSGGAVNDILTTSSQEAGGQPEWIEEAVKLFGEDLVVIKDKD